MTKDEALDLALKAFESIPEEVEGYLHELCTDAVIAIKQARSAPVQEPVAWKNAAIRLGEELSSVGPDGYYDMTAEQWLDWAMDQQPRGKNSLPAAQQPVAVVSGYYGGQCVILPIDPARIFNSNTPLYTSPPAQPETMALPEKTYEFVPTPEPAKWHHPECEGECIACLIERVVQEAYGSQGLGYLQRHLTSPQPCPTCEALARTVMLDQTSHDTQRTWVGLSDDEISARATNFYNPEMYKRAVLWAQEKLKERNQ